MTVDMDPAATFAVVVGIERYDIGWSLDGAANDAIRAASWLLAAGVPAGQVFLAINALPDNLGQVEERTAELGLQLHKTDREHVMEIFTQKLTATQAKHLVVFWSGHGVLDAQRRRALYTSDASTVDRKTVRVDDLLAFLGDKKVPGLHDQVVIIDACANFIETRNRDSLTYSTFPSSGSKHGVRQFVLYAAAQGQIASQDQTAKHGEFANLVLTTLHPVEQPQWPPDMPALSKSVAAHFERLREKGYCRQTPVYLSRHTGWTGDESQHHFGGVPVSGDLQRIAGMAGITTSQLHRLIRAVEGSPIPIGADKVAEMVRHDRMGQLLAEMSAAARGNDQLLAVEQIRLLWSQQQRVAVPLRHFEGVSMRQLRTYYDMVPDRQLAPHLVELDEVLEYLAGFSAELVPHPLLRFVARLEGLTGVRVPEDWFGLRPATLEALRGAEQLSLSAARGCHLVLDLRRPGAEWPTEVSGHLRGVDGQWSKKSVDCAATKAGARDAVNRLITWAHQYSVDGSTLTLGFLVSRARFDDVPESWTYVDDLSGELPLGEEYPVVLHSGDRIGVQRARDRWRGRARRIAGALELAAPEILWIEAPLDAREIAKAVLGTDAACVVFADVPGPLKGSLPVDPLIAAINQGAPYLIWLDDQPHSWDAARDTIAALVRNGEFDDVPLRALGIRQKQAAATSCSGIRVLWDKQELLPEFGKLTGIDMRTA